LTAFSTIAEDIRFTVAVSSSRISIQDFLQVEYLIENSRKVSQFIPPDLSNFEVVEGPEQASGWNMENGVLKEYVSFSYLLKPRKQGRFLIPQATARIDGKVYRTKSIMIEVAPSVIPGVSEDLNFADELVMRKGESLGDKVRNNIFLKLDISRPTCYEGEAVIATYKLYTRLRSESKVINRPSFNGFSVYDMVNPESEAPYRERLNGREYNVYVLRKVQLYPLQSGKIDLDPIEVENTLTFVKSEELKSGLSMGRILKNLAEGNEDEAVLREKVNLSTTTASIQVKPLPAPAEPGFAGAVGNFEVRAMVSSNSVNRNDVVNLVIRVSGKGNFPMFGSPEVNWPDSTEVFEASVQEHFSKFVSPLSGSKVYNIPFTVQQAGDVVIPPVNLHYFDPQKGSYAVAQSDPISLHVEPAPAKSQARKINIPAVQPGSLGAWMWIIYIIGFVVVGGSVYLLMRRNIKHASPRSVTDEMAGMPEKEVERDPLEHIREAFEKGDSRQFYRQLGFVINDCLRKKYNVRNVDEWESVLVKTGIDADMITAIRALKEDAAMAMYTPFVMESKMVDDLARIEKMIC
jgi:hypothetical protein